MKLALRSAALGMLLVTAGVYYLRGSSGESTAVAQRIRPQETLNTQSLESSPNIVRQGFPAAGYDKSDITKSETAWEIEWELTHPNNRPYYPPGSMLRIKSAKFMWKDKQGKPQWITVVRMLETAEIYVPYDNGNTAFLDIHDMPFYMTPARKEFLGPNCVAPGELIKSSNPAWNHTLHKEVHDDGVRWMSAETNMRNQISDRVRRGEKMILWGTYYGANYRYLIEYNFGDDGTLVCRIGPTGRNIFNRQSDLSDTHLHIGCWRMEMDLGDPITKKGGPKSNDVILVRRVYDEANEKFGLVTKPFNKNFQNEACEGSARWVPEEFTTVRFQSKERKNSHGRSMAYDVISQRFGSIRQLQPEGGSYESNMDFINQDFWVTRTEPSFTEYINVPTYAKEKRPLTDQATTLWLCTPAIHAARGEDFGPSNGTNSYSGVAITTWASFILKPRELFDSTPLYKSSPIFGR
ncbi:hypothetical protein KIH39_11025 [Telmatocola sphagniphila]|uniref:Copper amine oxidase catalytic domain-containing protein n=1 Tax=Telmatocola sphagniphila TaxID=1123043 RepID=A0A8E6BAH2_9BACT|nr:hypothetical protein [Telmatocola sphagniphila]QVL34409.1 hypothetical protein KIH39_11025 [Telmatocola sphagniphila]